MPNATLACDPLIFRFISLSLFLGSHHQTNTQDVVAKIDGKRQESLLGGGLKRIETQHKKACYIYSNFFEPMLITPYLRDFTVGWNALTRARLMF